MCSWGFVCVRVMFRVMCDPPCVGGDQLLPEQRSIRSSSSEWRAHIRSCSPSIHFLRATFLLFVVRPFINTPLELGVCPNPVFAQLCADYGDVGSWEGTGTCGCVRVWFLYSAGLFGSCIVCRCCELRQIRYVRSNWKGS